MTITTTTTKLRLSILSVFIFCFVSSYTTLAFSQPVLIPHTAEYSLKMKNRSTGSPLASMNGTMLYIIDDECSDWSVTQNFKLFYLYNNQKTVTEEKYFSNFESKNGNNLQFASKTISNNVISEDLRGTASNGKVIFSNPDNIKFNLNNKTVFPNRYILELLEYAETGGKFFNKTMFNGADKDGFIEINSFIGRKLSIEDIVGINNNKNIDKKLLGKHAWEVRMAFFPVNKETSLPSHEIDLILHDNGVVSTATVLYKGFSITEHIEALSKRPKNAC